MANVLLKNIRKVYGKDVVAVHDFNLEIADKEFVVLVGPSGCGKSTTLRMIAGLEELTDGELYIDGKLMNAVPPSKRDIAMVFQNYALYPHMSVYDNMSFSLRLQKSSKAEIDEKVRDAAELLGITNLLDRKPKALSGGQRQRVAIGRAIVRAPKVFLMDEPLSNLDAKLRNQMRAELIKLRKKLNTTFVYVTHDQTEAMTLGDRIVIMKDGYVQQTGTPREVFDSPANKFVAGFIGMPQMNFLPGRVVETADGLSVEALGLTRAFKEDQRSALGAKKFPCEIEVGIRPEHLRICEEDGVDAVSAIIEMTGSEAIVHAETGDREVVIRAMPDHLPANFRIAAGETNHFKLDFRAKHVHLFDPESGESLFRTLTPKE